MKNILIMGLLFASSLCAAQVNPPPVSAYTFSGGSWVAAASLATTGALTYQPPASALYCFNSVTLKWVPADSTCLGSGGPVSGGPQTSGSPFAVPGVSGIYWNNTASTYSFNLPVPVAGLQLCFGNYQARSGAVSIIPTTGVTIYFKGVGGTAGSATGLVSSGAAGDFICVVGGDATTYMAIGGGFGTWTNN